MYSDYKHLPVYRDLFRLLTWSYASLQKVARMYRYTILEPLRLSLLEALLLICDVSRGEDRSANLRECDRLITRSEILFTLLYELGALRASQIVYVSGELANIRKQLAGWRRSIDATVTGDLPSVGTPNDSFNDEPDTSEESDDESLYPR